MERVLDFFELQPVTGDFDGNGFYECSDIDALTAAIVAVKNGSQADTMFDLTGDGNVTNADLDAWLMEAGAAGLTSGGPVLYGDANLDGTVDGQDFLAWNTNKFTSTSAWCDGDFNADGTVDGSDFLIWNASKFTTADQIARPSLQVPYAAPAAIVVQRTEATSSARLAPIVPAVIVDRFGIDDDAMESRRLTRTDRIAEPPRASVVEVVFEQLAPRDWDSY